MPEPRPAPVSEPHRAPRPELRVLVTAAPQLEPDTDDRRPALRLVRPASRTVADPSTPPAPDAPRTAPARPAPDPAAVVGAHRVLRLVLEVQDGRRSPAQLRHLLSPAALEALVRVARDRARTIPGRVERVHVQQVVPGVAEVVATVFRGTGADAVAARLELAADGWRCTVLRMR